MAVTETQVAARTSDEAWSSSLRETAEGLQIGCAVGGVLPDALSASERALLLRHFNVLTPENCMKPERIHPTEAAFDFGPPDALVHFATESSMGVVGHCLVWHQQCPDWFFVDGVAAANSELVRQRMRDHIHTVVGRYKGKVQGWDVVNEAIADHGDYLRESKWKQACGETFIDDAFYFAHEADPDAKLYYNDYNNVEVPEKRARTLRLLENLRSRGVPIHGVGVQGHFILDQIPFEALEESIILYNSLGLEVMITELDIDVVGRAEAGADIAHCEGTSGPGDPFAGGCPVAVLERQAQQYAEIFRVITKHRDKIGRVSFWGLHDGLSWLNYWPDERTNHPLLFDRACRAKPALGSVLRVLRDETGHAHGHQSGS